VNRFGIYTVVGVAAFNSVAACAWAAGQFVPIGDLAGGAFSSRALAVSADGTTVVGFGTSAEHGMRNLRSVLQNWSKPPHRTLFVA